MGRGVRGGMGRGVGGGWQEGEEEIQQERRPGGPLWGGRSPEECAPPTPQPPPPSCSWEWGCWPLCSGRKGLHPVLRRCRLQPALSCQPFPKAEETTLPRVRPAPRAAHAQRADPCKAKGGSRLVPPAQVPPAQLGTTLKSRWDSGALSVGSAEASVRLALQSSFLFCLLLLPVPPFSRCRS